MPDDGRGVAIVDWDADGDLDMWISNRNAPRIRLMRNETPSDNHFIALRLVGNGTDTNRDAIGARVEVFLSSEQSQPLMRTLRAGDGFLSQSSKWLHFGLGEAARIDRVVVRWPSEIGMSGEVETFSGVTTNGRFRLVQGRSKAETVAARTDAIALEAHPIQLPEPVDTVRARSVSLYRIPKFKAKGSPTRPALATGEGKAVLFNLWGSWCRPCREELEEFAERKDELRQAGIEVVALSIDSLDQDNGDVEAAKHFIRKIHFPFVAKDATDLELKMFEYYDNALTTRNRPLPIPSSFLIDRQGHVAVIYKGRVGVDQLLKDVNHSQQSLAGRWRSAAPLKGSLIDHAAVAATRQTYEATVAYRHGMRQLREDRLDEAIYHLSQAVAYRPDFADAQNHLGVALTKTGKLHEAYQTLTTALSLEPDSASIHYHLAMLHMEASAIALASTAFRNAIRVDADGIFARTDLAKIVSKQEITSKEMFIRVQNMVSLHRRVAWQLATSPDEHDRDGVEAMRWAQRVVDVTGRKQPGPLWTLAAAFADQQRFKEAIVEVEEAMRLVEQLRVEQIGDDKPPISREQKARLLKQLQGQLDLYQQDQPYREPSKAEAAEGNPKD